jgi:nicotinate-nucleotide pyrophosphorylase (carboxylating)
MDMPTFDQEQINQTIRAALAEDVGSGDVTTTSVVPEGTRARGAFRSRSPGIVAGLQFASRVFAQLPGEVSLQLHVNDGDAMDADMLLATVEGDARTILTGERLALNLLGRLSGIATLTRQFVDAVAGTKAVILDTRKTTPLLRHVERYAVAVGGGTNHRLGLFDQVLIKDNHLAALPIMQEGKDDVVELRVREAVRRARKSFHGLVEIEVDALKHVMAAADAGADIILLDNFTVAECREAVAMRDVRDQQQPHPLLEASGGITLNTVREFAQTGIDRISVGALTHSAVSLDIGLDFDVLA